ncbi:MAG: sulfite reductase, ferredoxin dependent [Oscillatoriales cyanobacterium SM2_2_1]|nr:sulfite reductase, ferredoxin dependent [Oscillatoriales cyanobacterium SM2_2_1]
MEVLKRSKVELIKENSRFLRGPIDAELTNELPSFSHDGVQILKFHGSYQQKFREPVRVKGQEPQYSMMLRTRSPGGMVPWQLYLALDRLSDTYGNGTLRATTRQGFQIHGILKADLKTVVADIVRHMGSTVGACGDINRNVMAPPAPLKQRPEYQIARDYAVKIADLLAPQAGAYYDVWLDGELFLTAEEAPEVVRARAYPGIGSRSCNIPNSPEPIYGTQFLPRKFKMAIAVPGDNSVDLFTNDLSLVVITDGDRLLGFNVYVGGGLGRSHNNDDTIVRLADPLGFVPADEILMVVKAIVAVQRDFGDRYNRKHARFKYLLNDWGVGKFRDVLREYYPHELAPPYGLPEWRYQDYLGWHEQGDGQYFVGISIENGRVHDSGTLHLKTALRKIGETYQRPLYLTPNHNLLIGDISDEQRGPIQDILNQCGVLPPERLDSLVRYSMACPALPSCGLAITESERILPAVLDRIRTLLTNLGLGNESMVIRMTGCPNGCARPYMAELGFVGSGVNEYQVWLGGNIQSTRLAQPYVQRLALDELESGLEPLFVYFQRERQDQERFGDFCARMGLEHLRHFAEHYRGTVISQETLEQLKRKDQRHRVTLSAETYESVKNQAAAQGKSMKEFVEAALANYLQVSVG